jgi:hypothetical protein
MENSAQTPGNKPMPQYPKPSDELQKHIESVVPDAEKEDVPSANAAPEQVAHQETAAAPMKADETETSKDQHAAEKEEDPDAPKDKVDAQTADAKVEEPTADEKPDADTIGDEVK